LELDGVVTLLLMLLLLLGLLVASLLVDMNFFAVLLGTTEALFLMDADLFLDVGVAVVWGVNGGREGFVNLFVTFPSV
jgi:hypothetical protein